MSRCEEDDSLLTRHMHCMLIWAGTDFYLFLFMGRLQVTRKQIIYGIWLEPYQMLIPGQYLFLEKYKLRWEQDSECEFINIMKICS